MTHNIVTHIAVASYGSDSKVALELDWVLPIADPVQLRHVVWVGLSHLVT